eukprot:TRINITY_DN4999_c0_g1_i1.p1 TRINITY_DN4999_c0_g1~~TRINITY_DN4999_c0_g1_i1.p1  ORF type:complete len:143 (+),score=17.72 TRINITY_DN4999_c0_g1_i1:455-883(+)
MVDGLRFCGYDPELRTRMVNSAVYRDVCAVLNKEQMAKLHTVPSESLRYDFTQGITQVVDVEMGYTYMKQLDTGVLLANMGQLYTRLLGYSYAYGNWQNAVVGPVSVKLQTARDAELKDYDAGFHRISRRGRSSETAKAHRG